MLLFRRCGFKVHNQLTLWNIILDNLGGPDLVSWKALRVRIPWKKRRPAYGLQCQAPPKSSSLPALSNSLACLIDFGLALPSLVVKYYPFSLLDSVYW